MIEQDIITSLGGDSTLTALVGSRIYPLSRPQGDPLPAIVYQRIATTPLNSINGFSRLDAVRIQFSCYAKTLLAAKELAEALRSAMDADTALKAICVMEMDDQDEGTRNFRTVVDFHIWQRY